MMSVGDLMSTLGMFSTPEDTMNTPGAYHDECGGDIISTAGGVQYTGGYHEYTGGGGGG